MVDRIKNERDGFMRPYNFASLEEGNYQIEINDHNGKVVLPLSPCYCSSSGKSKD
jgi:hypothetical protein